MYMKSIILYVLTGVCNAVKVSETALCTLWELSYCHTQKVQKKKRKKGIKMKLSATSKRIHKFLSAEYVCSLATKAKIITMNQGSG